jgi:hypothetical protein
MPIGKMDSSLLEDQKWRVTGWWLILPRVISDFWTKLGGKVLSWNTDDGVDECLDKNLGLYVEKFSNMLLGGKLEWDDSIGFISLG